MAASGVIIQPTDADATSGSPKAAGGGTAPKRPWQSILHECFAVVLSAVIVAVASYMLIATFAAAGKVNVEGSPNALAYEHQKDVMLYALSLLGTVTGYYLGRAPAERRADNAREGEITSQRVALKAQREAAEATSTAKVASAEKDITVRRAETLRTQAQHAVRDAKAAVAAVGKGHIPRAILGADHQDTRTPAVPDVATALSALERAEAILEVDT